MPGTNEGAVDVRRGSNVVGALSRGTAAAGDGSFETGDRGLSGARKAAILLTSLDRRPTAWFVEAVHEELRGLLADFDGLLREIDDHRRKDTEGYVALSVPSTSCAMPTPSASAWKFITVR